MEFEDMTKEELVAILKELKKQRAFTYEDQMKLAILDESPFTIWASDRECKITLWDGQCEALYGYSRDYVIGKDYIPLIVAPDEQPAARRDQLSIIEDAAVFHNIANDIARTGNTLQLITNCFRIKDPRTGQYWNAEMGLIIDYLDQEKERLELIVAESKKVKSSTTLFIENTRQRKTQYQERKKALRIAIADRKKKAAATKRLTSFNEKITPINNALDELQSNLYQLIEDFTQRFQACADAVSCETVILEFDEAYEEMVYSFEDIFANFEEISSEFNWDNEVLHLRDDLLKSNFESSKRLDNLVFELFKKAEEDIAEYKKLGATDQARRLNELLKRREEIRILRETITKISNDFTDKTQQSTDNAQLTKLRSEMTDNYRDFEDKLLNYRRDMGVNT